MRSEQTRIPLPEPRKVVLSHGIEVCQRMFDYKCYLPFPHFHYMCRWNTVAYKESTTKTGYLCSFLFK